jgi:hypothetical protein
VFGDPVAGWASLISVTLLIAGIQLFCQGIMGQYIAKIYMETKKRPHYIISESSQIKVEEPVQEWVEEHLEERMVTGFALERSEEALGLETKG